MADALAIVNSDKETVLMIPAHRTVKLNWSSNTMYEPAGAS
jgi:hypothetical protein